MTIESMTIGMRVRHPQYGEGTVRSISPQTVEILFGDGLRTVSPGGSHLEPATPMASIQALEMPLSRFIEQAVAELVERLGLQRPEDVTIELAKRWHDGVMVLRPADPALQAKEVPLETFFHKIVMMRNNLRVLEQKLNGHQLLSEADKVELQQYITKCYGSMTTFNILFASRDDQFGAGE